MVAGVLLVLTASASAAQPVVIMPSAPPIVAAPIASSTADNPRRLLMWTPGEVRCEGTAIAPVKTLRRPYNALVFPRAVPPGPVTLRFVIDRTGRVHSIARDAHGGSYQSDDIAPAFASSRFAPYSVEEVGLGNG